MEITFSNPVYLFFLVSIPFLIISHFFTMRYLKRRALKFANFEAIKRVTGGEKSVLKNSTFLSTNILVLVNRIMIILLLVLAAAGTVLWTTGKISNSDYIIAIDSSSSMLADDFEPSRLAAAKEASIAFIDSLSARAQIGVVSFSGNAFIEQELTGDFGRAKEAVDNIKIRTVGGTNIGDTIITSANLLEKSEKSKVIILLTDGRSNVGTSVEEAISYAQEKNIKINTIGVATEQGGRFLRIDAVSRIDEPTLKAIASSTGGTYYPAADKATLIKAFRDATTSSTELISTKLSFIFLLIALALIFVEWGLISTKYKTVP